MKRIISLIAFALIFSGFASAQDIVTKRSGEKVEAVVLEINPDNIRYRLFANPEGPVYTVPISQIAKITYKNGTEDVFPTSVAAADPARTPAATRTPAPAGTPGMTRQPVPAVPPVVSQPPLGLKYRQLKYMYDPREYVRDFDDFYSPAWCGVGSLIIPGLGQMCCGEWGRGLAFLAANSACGLMALGTENDIWYVCQLAVGIWSICDAFNVARVVNMYHQDLRGTLPHRVNFYPSFTCLPGASGAVPTAGLTLSLSL